MPLFSGPINGAGDFSSNGFSAHVTFNGTFSAPIVIGNGGAIARVPTYRVSVGYSSAWTNPPPGNPQPPSGSMDSGGTESGTAGVANGVNFFATSGTLAFGAATINGGSLTGNGTATVSGF